MITVYYFSMWCAIHLPRLAVDLAERGHAAAGPLVIITGQGARAQVVVGNAAAESSGIEAGMTLTAAQALVPQLRHLARDPIREQQALMQLADWAGQYSSLVSTESPDGLLIEIGRSLALFGEIESVVESLRRELDALGFHVAVAYAPTPLAAMWFARWQHSRPPQSYFPWQQRLRQVPLSVLADATLRIGDLHAMGLRTVGDVLDLPRAALSQRVGPTFMHALDRALGHAPDPRHAYVAPTQFRQRIELLAPATTTDPLLFVLRRLCLALEGFLRARHAGISELNIELSYTDHGPTQHRLGLQKPSRELVTWVDVAREWLTRATLPDPVTALELSVSQWWPLPAQQQDAYAEPRSGDQSAVLLSRLQARLGVDAVHSVRCVAEHRPEYAWQFAVARWNDDSTENATSGVTRSRDEGPPVATTSHIIPSCAPGQATYPGEPPYWTAANAHLYRPLWLLPQPVPLQIVAQRPWYDGELHLSCGPERIESGWWDDRDVRRDYFLAHSIRGERLWIFRTLSTPAQWFLHGYFG